MNDLHDKLIAEVAKNNSISKFEAEKMVNAMWRLIEKTVSDKEVKVISCIKLGKFYPTSFRRLQAQGKIKRKDEQT